MLPPSQTFAFQWRYHLLSGLSRLLPMSGPSQRPISQSDQRPVPTPQSVTLSGPEPGTKPRPAFFPLSRTARTIRATAEARNIMTSSIPERPASHWPAASVSGQTIGHPWSQGSYDTPRPLLLKGEVLDITELQKQGLRCV